MVPPLTGSGVTVPAEQRPVVGIEDAVVPLAIPQCPFTISEQLIGPPLVVADELSQ
jgi:hypothetical protein